MLPPSPAPGSVPDVRAGHGNNLLPINSGLLVDPAVTQRRFRNLEHGALANVEALVLHQTAAPTAQHTFNAYGHSTHQYGAHFLIAKNG